MNKVILMGRLTKDPELNYTNTNSTAKCSFTLAVDRRFSKPGEGKQADFINIVAWKGNAEFCSKHFTKGLKVVVIGSMQNRSWDDRDGKKHYVTEVIIDEAYFADGKKADAESKPPIQSSSDPSTPHSDYPVEALEDDDLPF